MRNAIHLYAVVRVDDYLRLDNLETAITVKEVLPTLEEAMQEVERLNELNSHKGCRYFCQVTRYFPEGRTNRVINDLEN